jgi:hypothetical protein
MTPAISQYCGKVRPKHTIILWFAPPGQLKILSSTPTLDGASSRRAA